MVVVVKVVVVLFAYVCLVVLVFSLMRVSALAEPAPSANRETPHPGCWRRAVEWGLCRAGWPLRCWRLPACPAGQLPASWAAGSIEKDGR